jgi:hypothetical protein
MPIETIRIVRTAQQPFETVPYIVHKLARLWRERGLAVEVAHSLSEPAGDEVLIIPHFDLTVRPASFAAQIAQSAHVINRAVVDDSKRAISGQLVTGPDQFDGPVLVKTDRNCGGFPEAFVRSAEGVTAVGHPPVLHWGLYQVYDHPRLVPPTVWNYPPLVVEKFLPEKEDGQYCLRQYVFFGGSEIYSRAFSSKPIVKASNVDRRDILTEPPPPEVVEVRRRLGFDYGKFDFVIHDGKPIVFDVNPTPTYNPASKVGSQDETMARLADGIRAILDPR